MKREVPFGDVDRHVQNCTYQIVQYPHRCGCSNANRRANSHAVLSNGRRPIGYQCRFMYTNGGYPSHCDYYLTAWNVWHSDPHRWRHANANRTNTSMQRLRGDGASQQRGPKIQETQQTDPTRNVRCRTLCQMGHRTVNDTTIGQRMDIR